MNPQALIATPQFVSLLVLAIASAGFLFFALRFARAHLVAANIAELERMRAEGILVGEPRQDYRTLTYLLTTVAGAVSLPAEFWISAYWVVIRACGLLAAKPWVERQTQLLAAYQACRYRTAVNRLLELAA